MARKLPKVDVVIVGVGWAGGIIAKELTKKGLKVVGLERGKERKTEDYFMVHDELRYALRYELMQDLSRETITFRGNEKYVLFQCANMVRFCSGMGLADLAYTGTGKRSAFCPMILKSIVKPLNGMGKRKFQPT